MENYNYLEDAVLPRNKRDKIKIPKDIIQSTIKYLKMILNNNELELSEQRDVDSLIDWFGKQL